MSSRTLKKSILNFWQEIIFIISIGIVLFNILQFNRTQNEFDAWDLLLLSITIPLFISLIGQLFWNNKILSTYLSILLIIASLIVVFMGVYYVGTTTSELLQAVTMLIIGIFLLLTAITMKRKQKSSIEI